MIRSSMLAKATELCEASFGTMWLVADDGYMRAAASVEHRLQFTGRSDKSRTNFVNDSEGVSYPCIFFSRI